MNSRAMASVAGWIVLLATGAMASSGGDRQSATEVLLKVKPAVVLIITEVGGEVQVTCPNKPPKSFSPPSIQAHGTGYIVNPDGYILTNGHVVQPYYEKKDPEVRETFLRQAIENTCVESSLPEDQRKAAVRQLYPQIAPSAEIELKKTLTVVLPNREKLVAEVKAYSPALDVRPGKRVTATQEVTESGKDVAVLKIDAKNLPTVPLGDSDRVQVGQPIRILGFPGVVLYHDLLDKRSAVEATVTTGYVSSLKMDARGAPVIQTDAAASWGNSGGPAINERGEVVGMLTFISLTSDETQAIQGFNFLVPANTVKEFARSSRVALNQESPFTKVWHEAVSRYVRGNWSGAQAELDAANRLLPNLPDVQRLQAEVQLRLLQSSPWPSPFLLGGIAVMVVAVAGGTWMVLRRRRHPVPATATPTPAEFVGEAPPGVSAPNPTRVPVKELARIWAERPEAVIIDVRSPASYESSQVQAKGALRATADRVLQVVTGLEPTQRILLYCDAPDEALSARAAQLLLQRGFTRVGVVTGGFAAWEGGAMPLERTPHARAGAVSASDPTWPASATGSADTVMTEISIDLPVGVKGTGPYFNARAKAISMAGLVLDTSQTLAPDQKLRLTLYISGESLDITGRVTSVQQEPPGSGTPRTRVSFEALSEETTITLEGFILAHVGGGPAA